MSASYKEMYNMPIYVRAHALNYLCMCGHWEWTRWSEIMMNTADKNDIHCKLKWTNWRRFFFLLCTNFFIANTFTCCWPHTYRHMRVYSSLSYAVNSNNNNNNTKKKCRQSQRVSLGCLMVLPYAGTHYCHLLLRL